METDRDHLRFAISYALKSYQYAKPRSPDRTASDRYYDAIADVIIKQMVVSWEIRRKPVRNPGTDSWLVPPGQPPISD